MNESGVGHGGAGVVADSRGMARGRDRRAEIWEPGNRIKHDLAVFGGGAG